MKRNGAKKWPLGFGILYLMINLHIFNWLFVKIGITGVGAFKRADGLDKDVPGIPIPVAIFILPFVYQIEQFLHRVFALFSWRFYRGDGSTEWFLLVVGAPLFYVCYWWYWPFVIRMLKVVLNYL